METLVRKLYCLSVESILTRLCRQHGNGEKTEICSFLQYDSLTDLMWVVKEKLLLTAVQPQPLGGWSYYPC